MDYKEVLTKIKARDEETKALYQRLYNFSMGENLEKFNLVVDTDNLSQEGVLKKVLKKIKE